MYIDERIQYNFKYIKVWKTQNYGDGKSSGVINILEVLEQEGMLEAKGSVQCDTVTVDEQQHALGRNGKLWTNSHPTCQV